MQNKSHESFACSHQIHAPLRFYILNPSTYTILVKGEANASFYSDFMLIRVLLQSAFKEFCARCVIIVSWNLHFKPEKIREMKVRLLCLSLDCKVSCVISENMKKERYIFIRKIRLSTVRSILQGCVCLCTKTKFSDF